MSEGRIMTQLLTLGDFFREAPRLMCFRAPGKPKGSKATEDDFMACLMKPGHDGDCIFGNRPALITTALKLARAGDHEISDKERDAL